MQNCNAQNLTVLLSPPKMQVDLSRVGHKQYRYNLLNGQKFIMLPNMFEKEKFHNFIIDFGVIALQVPGSPDYLTLCEADDVEASLEEIKAGKAKKFKSVDAFLKELKE
jgi:hypothetical protein